MVVQVPKSLPEMAMCAHYVDVGKVCQSTPNKAAT
jgi:hypothetical protein